MSGVTGDTPQGPETLFRANGSMSDSFHVFDVFEHEPQSTKEVRAGTHMRIPYMQQHHTANPIKPLSCRGTPPLPAPPARRV
jgi:hypothetical protein